MLWNELICLQEWMPISGLTFQHDEIGYHLYKIEDTKYFMVTPYNSLSLEDAPGGPFLAALVWACSDGAAMRAIKDKIEDDDKVKIHPPPELLPSEDALTYGAILSGLKSRGAKGVFESAGYRWSDGKFVHRVIDSSVANYYFRGRKERDDEIPYAIRWNLKNW